jgi:hypothetical protein
MVFLKKLRSSTFMARAAGGVNMSSVDIWECFSCPSVFAVALVLGDIFFGGCGSDMTQGPDDLRHRMRGPLNQYPMLTETRPKSLQVVCTCSLCLTLLRATKVGSGSSARGLARISLTGVHA